MVGRLEIPGDIIVIPIDSESQDQWRNRAVKSRMLQACGEEPDRDEFDHLLVDPDWFLQCVQAGRLGPIMAARRMQARTPNQGADHVRAAAERS